MEVVQMNISLPDSLSGNRIGEIIAAFIEFVLGFLKNFGFLFSL